MQHRWGLTQLRDSVFYVAGEATCGGVLVWCVVLLFGIDLPTWAAYGAGLVAALVRGMAVYWKSFRHGMTYGVSDVVMMSDEAQAFEDKYIIVGSPWEHEILGRGVISGVSLSPALVEVCYAGDKIVVYPTRGHFLSQHTPVHIEIER